MTVKVRLLLVIGLVCVLVMIINMVRKRQLELKYVLGWLGCDFVLLNGRIIKFSWNLCTGKYDFFPWFSFFTDSGVYFNGCTFQSYCTRTQAGTDRGFKCV